MHPGARDRKAKALECERRADAAENPGVREAYRRVAAQWSEMASQVRQPPARGQYQRRAKRRAAPDWRIAAAIALRRCRRAKCAAITSLAAITG
jgi:hypothetical protein